MSRIFIDRTYRSKKISARLQQQLNQEAVQRRIEIVLHPKDLKDICRAGRDRYDFVEVAFYLPEVAPSSMSTSASIRPFPLPLHRL